MWSRRLAAAPRAERTVPTLSMASASVLIMALAAVPVVISAPGAVVEADENLVDTAFSAVFRVDMPPETSIDIFSVELAPIWNVMVVDRVGEPAVPAPSPSSLLPPNVVLLMMLYSSWPRASNSACMAFWSSVFDEASAACVARSFMRTSMLVTSPNAPSAVCSIEVLFCVLLMATVMPLVWAFRRVAICRPAASSMAELMR